MVYRDKLERRIRIFTETIWKDKIEEGLLPIWLDNFKDTNKSKEEQERLNMLYLLSKFMYYGNKETREMLKCVYRDKFQYKVLQAIKTFTATTSSNPGILYEKELKATRFLGVGNPSESGVHLMYYFRQENDLSKEIFINTHEIFQIDGSGKVTLKDPNIKRYIFIDDFCGTGHQAIDYSKEIVDVIKGLEKTVEVAYYPLFATEYAIANILAHTSFDHVEPVFVLDESFKCFSATSRYFQDTSSEPSIDKTVSKGICVKYGAPLFHPPLGYNDCQLLIGFFHNTPDNTLPIFWSENNSWKPFFKRFHKK